MDGQNHSLQTNFLTKNSNLTLPYLASFLGAGLMAVASSYSLLFPEQIYPTDALRQTFLANDVVNLVIALPFLLGSLILTLRRKLLGLLLWPGALLYISYNYIAYLFGIPMHWLYLLYLSLVAICIYTLIGITAQINAEAVRQHLGGAVPEKLSAGIIIGLGLINILRVFIVLFSAFIGQGGMPGLEISAMKADFLLSPAWILGGILLWQRKALGYVVGLALLFQTSMLFVGLIVFLILQPLLTTAPFAFFDVIVVTLMGMICFIPFGIFMRRVGTSL